MSLFRKEALAARQHRWLGEIVLVRPLPLLLLTCVSVVFALAVMGFLVWGAYTKRTTVSGHVVPAGGLLKIYAPEPALVLEAHVTEGQSVRAGDVLYVLSGERQSAAHGATHASIGQRLEERRLSLQHEIAQTSVLHSQEADAARSRLAIAEAGLARLDDHLSLQRDRVGLAQQTWQRYRNLMEQDYIAREQLQQKQEEVLEQRAQLQALQRERLVLQRDLEAVRTELAGLAVRHENQLAQLQRALAEITQELVENAMRRSLVITAPRDGAATAVLAHAGQMVGGDRPLVSLVPQGAPLHVELYAPSRAVGFVNPGDTVRLRFDAYPYQKFGHHQGIVESVARTALPPLEWNAPDARHALAGQTSAPLYRITVSLAGQSIRAYGLERELQAGMTLEADILHEKLRLYEWIFEPLRTLSGKF
ncbi:MAG: HlyD family secretion protein [Pigmentiphaga sp.]